MSEINCARGGDASRVSQRRFQAFLLCCVVPFSAGALARAADLDRTVTFDIEAQPLEQALLAFSQQADIQVVLNTDMGSAAASAVKGTVSARAGLGELLKGTGYRFAAIGNGTVSVVRDTRLAQATTASTSAEPSEAAPHVEEIVVTAQKREEKLEDVPISVSVLSGQGLDHSMVQGVTEALGRVPGIAADGGYQPPVGTQLGARGVAAANGIFFGSSTMGYYIDSVPFAFVKSAIVPDPNAYDLARVEVLRGPQGTLYGASALNGVVRVLTSDADLDSFALKARTAFSSTEKGGDNARGDVAVNVPIIDGRLAARAVVGYQDLSGWIDKPNRKDANDAELRNVRLKVNARPTDALSIGLSAWRSNSDFGAPSFSANGLTSPVVTQEPVATDFDALSLKVDYELPRFSITSMTSYLDYSNENYLDRSVAGVADILHTSLHADTIAQEFLLSSDSAGAWRWSAGGMYRKSEDRAAQNSILPAATFATTHESESVAIFGELTREFLQGQLELTAGLRRFEDEVTETEPARPLGLPPAGVYGRNTFHATTPRVVVTWHPRERMTVYSSYSEGFRSGSSQPPNVLRVAAFAPVKPDKLKNYELGVKGTPFGGRLSYDSAVYYVDWQDVQQALTVTHPSGLFAVITNGESASGIGVDFGLTAQASDRLEISANLSWNDLEIDGDELSGGLFLYRKGDRLSHSPEWTAGFSADYVFPIGGGGLEARFSAAANYVSSREFRALAGGRVRINAGDSMLISRVSFAIDAADRWTFSLFVDNAGNEMGSPIRQPFGPTETRAWDARVRPRTVGLQLEFRI